MKLSQKLPDPKKSTVPAVERAIRLLDVLSAAKEPMSLHELTERLKLPKSTVHGLCKTLACSGMLKRFSNGTYHLGIHIMSLAHAFLASADLTSDFLAIVNELKLIPEETIVLSVLDGADVVYLASRKGTRLFGFDFSMGMRLPANCAASGKAMLGTMSDGIIIEKFGSGSLQKLTPNSITDPDVFLKNLGQARKLGYAIDMEETRPGMVCIGAPVFRAGSAEAVAAIGISMPKSSLDQPRKEQSIEAVKTIAGTLSRRLGGGSAFL